MRTRTSGSRRAAVVAGLALIAAAACARGGTSAASPASPFYRGSFDHFHADVAPFDSGGECARQPQPPGSDARVVSAYFPNRADARSVVTLVYDRKGLRQMHEARGVVTVSGLGRTPTSAQYDSAFAAVQDTMRTTLIALDYRMHRVTAINRGRHRAQVRVVGDLDEALEAASLGSPGERVKLAAGLCGVPGRDVR